MTKAQQIKAIHNEQTKTELTTLKSLKPILRKLQTTIYKVPNQFAAQTVITNFFAEIEQTLLQGSILAFLIGKTRQEQTLKDRQPQALSLVSTALKAQSARTDTALISSLTRLYKPRIQDGISATLANAEKAIANSIALSIAEGEHTAASIGRLKQTFNAHGIAFDNPYAFEATVRTEIAVAYNIGKQYLNNQPAIQAILWGYEFSAVGDARTTDICQPLDGLKAPKDDPIWSRITPPNHFQCRSVLLEVFNEEKPDKSDGLPKDWQSDTRFDFNPGDMLP